MGLKSVEAAVLVTWLAGNGPAWISSLWSFRCLQHMLSVPRRVLWRAVRERFSVAQAFIGEVHEKNGNCVVSKTGPRVCSPLLWSLLSGPRWPRHCVPLSRPEGMQQLLLLHKPTRELTLLRGLILPLERWHGIATGRAAGALVNVCAAPQIGPINNCPF